MMRLAQCWVTRSRGWLRVAGCLGLWMAGGGAAWAQCGTGTIQGCLLDPANGVKMQSTVQLWHRAAEGDPWQEVWDWPEWLPSGDFRYSNVPLSQQYKVTACAPAAAYPRLDPLDYQGVLTAEQPSATCVFTAIRSTQPYRVDLLDPAAGVVGDYRTVRFRVLYVYGVNPPVYCHLWLARAAPPPVALTDLLLSEERPQPWEYSSWPEQLAGEGVVAATVEVLWPTTLFYNDNYDLQLEVHFDDYWSTTADLLAPVVSRSYAVRNLVIH